MQYCCSVLGVLNDLRISWFCEKLFYSVYPVEYSERNIVGFSTTHPKKPLKQKQAFRDLKSAGFNFEIRSYTGLDRN